jgi:hypothetical protein
MFFFNNQPCQYAGPWYKTKLTKHSYKTEVHVAIDKAWARVTVGHLKTKKLLHYLAWVHSWTLNIDKELRTMALKEQIVACYTYFHS